jgi:hypothetical protein
LCKLEFVFDDRTVLFVNIKTSAHRADALRFVELRKLRYRIEY